MKPILAFALVASVLAPIAVVAEPSAASSAGYVPVQITNRETAVYPIRLLDQGIVRGDVTAILEIDSQGKLRDHLITEYTHEEFAREVERAIQKWTFRPGTVNGEAIISILTVNFTFNVNGVTVYEKRFYGPDEQAQIGHRFVYFAHGPATLDRKIVPVTANPPLYLEEWMKEGRRGAVRIRFYIDETGRARLPTVVSESDTLLSSAAIHAIKDWRFEPPVANGKPVLAYAEQVFVFEPKVGMR